MKRLTVLIILVFFILPIFGFSTNPYLGQKKEFPALKGPYLGQEPPGMTPKVFAPEILSKYKHAFCSVFSPDGNEFYFTIGDPVRKKDIIMSMKRVNNIWTRPEAAPFNGSYSNNDLCLSPDGYRMFFRSWRPLPGSHTPEKRSRIWSVKRTKSGWSNPHPVKCGNVIIRAGYPSVSNNGTLYFPARRDDSIEERDIYRSRFINGSYRTPEHLGSTINTKYTEGDLCVAPDESFLIVSCWDRPDNDGKSDLYISFRNNDGSWTALKNMGKPVNKKHNEGCPTISPDGKYFFYFSYDPRARKPYTYWVDAKIIEGLKPKD